MGFLDGVGEWTGTSNPNAGKPNLDPRGPQFGGQGGSRDREDYLGYMGADGQKRRGAQADYFQTNQDAQRGLDDRVQQGQWGDYLKQVAMGTAGPSAAEQQMGQGLDASIRANSAMAGSVRGGGPALAAAQRQALDTNAQQQTQVVGQQGIVRAQEQATARGMYTQQQQSMRQQDLMARGMSAQEAQFQAQLEQQQHGLNDQYQLGMEGMANQVGLGTMGGATAAQIAEAQAKAQAAAQNAAGNQNLLGGMLGMGAGIAGAAVLASDARDKMNMQPLGAHASGAPGRSLMAYEDFANADASRASAPPPVWGSGDMLPSDAMMKTFHAAIDPTLNALRKGKGGSGGYEASLDAMNDIVGPSETDASPGVATAKAASENPEKSDRNVKTAIESFGMRLFKNAHARNGVVLETHSKRPGAKVASAAGDGAGAAYDHALVEGLHDNPAGSFDMTVSDRGDKRHVIDLDARAALEALSRPHERVAYPDTTAADIMAAMRHAPVARRDPGDTSATYPPARAHAPRDPRADEALAALGAGHAPIARRDAGDTAVLEVSDRHDKRGMAPEARDDAATFLDHLEGYTFNYKPGIQGEDPNHKYFGVMAQDVAKTPMGKSFVVHGPQGLELDTKHGFGAVLAALGNLGKRMRRVEGEGR